ncbi:MAG: polysaccharide biosynthesis C-terminal domain-containing protein, partial [Beijerinckiaceae bacterium]|nr:polysaccharide biosynthesis C-terminal domain-containing protein [Beijerinckiaceae bacterium]
VYLLRPVCIAAILTGIAMAGHSADASTAMAAVLAAIALATAVQGLFVCRAAPQQLFQVKSNHGKIAWIIGSAPLALAFLIDQLAAYADILALAVTVPSSETGAYFAAARIIALASLAPYAVSVIAGRDFAFHHASGDAAGLLASVRRTTRWTFWASTALLLVLLLTGPLLLSMFGRGFLVAAPCISLLALGLVARAAGGHGEDLLMALGHQAHTVRIATLSALVALGLAFIATPLFGLTGAAAAMTCAAAIRSVLFVRAARRLTGLYTGIGRDTFAGDKSP